MPDYEAFLARLTRRFALVKGFWRLTHPLAEYSSRRYQRNNHKDAWTTVQMLDGGLMRVNRANILGSYLYWQGYYSIGELYALRNLLKPSMVFVDVGANQGIFTVFAAKKLTQGQVLAFEPMPTLYQQLLDNIALNQLTNVQTYAIALADTSGELPLYVQKIDDQKAYNEGLGSMYQGSEHDSHSITVPVAKFDDIFPQSGLDRLDMIKVDIEGAELPFLRGAEATIAKFLPTLLIEVNDTTFQEAGYHKSDIVAFLKKLNYQLFIIGAYGKLRLVEDSEDLPVFCNLLCQAQAKKSVEAN